MRKWQNLAPQNDPNSYNDVDGLWPTERGTYETADYQGNTAYTAASCGNPLYAFAANKVSGTVEYVIDNVLKIWQVDLLLGTVTNRTGAAVVNGLPMMAQYGNVTICVMGSSTATVTASGGNFAALAGAPKGEIIVVQSNVVLIFNTDASADGWAASDVGDYTNWTTGEAASGRLLATPGRITAAVAWNDYVLVFKENSIYRMRYVGGLVKWSSELLTAAVGCQPNIGDALYSKYYACAGRDGVLFSSYYDGKGATYGTSSIYWFDGINVPHVVNPLTSIYQGWMVYEPSNDRFALHVTADSSASSFSNVYFYCPSTQMWGRVHQPDSSSTVTASQTIPVLGDQSARALAWRSGTPDSWYKSATNTLTRLQHGASISPASDTLSGSCYVETAMAGRVDRRSDFTRARPILRRRISMASGSAAIGLTASSFSELTGSVVQTQTRAESSRRNEFTFHITDTFVRAKVSFTNTFVEVDDVAMDSKDAGAI